MKFSNMKLAGALFASLSLACAGPAWSAEPTGKPTRTVAKAKVKAKAKPRVKAQAKARPRVEAKMEAVPAAVTAVAATTAVAAEVAAAPSAAKPAMPSGNPYLSNQPASTGNPYLVNRPVASANPYLASQPVATGNPYLAGQPVAASPSAGGSIVGTLKDLLPNLPGADGRSILPSIKKVYPTGEKPLVVLTFNCPTELIGFASPPIKALHGLVNLSFDALNATDLLSFNLQQVCQ